MGQKASVFALIVGVFLSAASAPGQSQALAPKYKTWLEEVSYISTTIEREVFQKLGSDEDRDRFIEEFWKQRDPIPATPKRST